MALYIIAAGLGLIATGSFLCIPIYMYTTIIPISMIHGVLYTGIVAGVLSLLTIFCAAKFDFSDEY